MKTKDLGFLAGGGEMGELMRVFDWAQSPAGPVDTWPQSLRTTLGILLHSKSPMLLFWGEDLIQFYNDAFRPSLGAEGKHPTALGQKGSECWGEAWPVIGHLVEQVRSGGESTCSEDQLVPVYRNGKKEDVYWTFGYSPVHDESGNVGGVLVICHESTRKALHSKELEETEKTLTRIFDQAPIAVAIFKGTDFVIDYANEKVLAYWGRTQEQVIQKPLFEALPEAAGQGFEEHLEDVRTTGQRYVAQEVPVDLFRNNRLEKTYINFVFEPYYDAGGSIAAVVVMANETTDQIETRKAVEDREQKFRNVVEQAAYPILILKGEDLILEVANEALFELWQVGPDAINKPFIEILPEMKGQPFVDLLLNVLHTGKAFHGNEIPAFFQRQNGQQETVYFNFTYQPYREADGRITGILVIATDVTEQVRLKQQAAESESRFRHMVEQAPVAITLTRGSDVVIDTINAPMLHIIGEKNAEEVIGKQMVEVLPEIKDQPVLAIVKNVRKTGEAFSGSEVPVSMHSGDVLEQHYYNLSYTPLTEDGVVTGVIHLAIDVTEQVVSRKKIEENREQLKRFQFMADNARDSFILMREDGSFAYLNDLALERWGYTREEAQHLRVHDVDLVYQQEKYKALFALAQKQYIPPFETTHQRKDGTTYPVEISVGWLILEGSPHLFAVARDIAERKLAEKTLKARNEELQRINNDLDNFIYTASHDLKAPISNIESLLQALLRTLPADSMPSDRVPLITGMMQESIDRFKKTITNLTEVVKLQQENEAEHVVVNLARLVQEVCLDLEPEINSSGARVEVAAEACPTVQFSEKNLRSIIYNLISNGIKYRSAGRTPRVQVRCENITAFYVLSVSDNGLGIEQGQSKQLFTMFKRFHDHVEGTGIGLYMVKKIVENAGGRIEVESQVGTGTEFRVYLPR